MRLNWEYECDPWVTSSTLEESFLPAQGKPVQWRGKRITNSFPGPHKLLQREVFSLLTRKAEGGVKIKAKLLLHTKIGEKGGENNRSLT